MVNNMTEQPDQDQHDADAALAQRSRELFNERVANLDGRTRSRLNQARQAALAAARGSDRSGLRWWAPVGSAAALTLVAMIGWQTLHQGAEVQMPEPSVNTVAGTVDDLEIMTSNDDLEMLRDVEFYAWLETEQDSLPGAVSAREDG